MLRNLLFSVLVFFLFSSFAFAQPEREVRAVWLTSVYNIDWPHSRLASAEVQQNRLRQMLDVLKETNINTILFQVRPNADALYQSAYEPWSEWVTGIRGAVPSYDPLAFVIEESQKRGMEVHAWLNPYRFEITAGEYSGLPGDYSETHPELIITHSGRTYFDPGNPATTQLIKKITADMVENYDLDGVVFDDYFYPSGLPNSADQATYDAFATEDLVLRYYSSMNRGNFRRASVNNMIREVNDTIKSIKPELIFGVSPAGIYSTQSSAAANWGTTLPQGITGADNYNSIYCDPLAWLDDGSVDYISPQLYWQIGGPQDYLTLVEWWGKEAERKGRHCYPSIGSYRLPADAKEGPSWLGIPRFLNELRTILQIRDGYSMGKNVYTLQEVENQILANRDNEINNVFGTIFFSTKDITSRVPTLAPFLAEGVFAEKTIFPVIDWIPEIQPGAPQIAEIGVLGEDPDAAVMNISSSSRNRFLLLGWDDMPTKNDWEGADFMQTLFGKDFSPFYPEEKNFFAVAELLPDRSIGNISGVFSYDPLETSQIITPEENQTVCDPFTFSWSSVEDGEKYEVLIATRQNTKNFIHTFDVDNQLSFQLPPGTLKGQEYYAVRVKAINGSMVSYSAPSPFFTGYPLGTILNTPTDGSENVSLTPTMQWNSVSGISHYHVQVATDPSFAEDFLVVDQEDVSLNFFTTPVLPGNTVHYGRVRVADECGYSEWSEVHSFTTEQGTAARGTEVVRLHAYPNPAKTQFFVRYPESIQRRIISIYANDGRLVKHLERSDNTSIDNIDISPFPEGFYSVTVESEQKVNYVFKILKTTH